MADESEKKPSTDFEEMLRKMLDLPQLRRQEIEPLLRPLARHVSTYIESCGNLIAQEKTIGEFDEAFRKVFFEVQAELYPEEDLEEIRDFFKGGLDAYQDGIGAIEASMHHFEDALQKLKSMLMSRLPTED